MSVAPLAVDGLRVDRGGEAVLRDISFGVREGEHVGLIGPNGAGKTTLFLTLLGLHPVAGGGLAVFGLNPARKAEADRIRRSVGLVFQNADDQLFCGVVADDVAFGPLQLAMDAEAVRRRVAAGLAAVEAGHLAGRLSHQLSAGEKRRVALATVLAMEPRMLLLDEPTGELDPRARRGLIELLRRRGETRLIATHDLEFVLATCDRVIVLADGQVRGDGPARALLADGALMAACGLEVPLSLAAR